MTHGFVLNAASALIELVVREVHDVERIGDLNGNGYHRVEHQPIRPDRSNVAYSMFASHSRPRASSHWHGSTALEQRFAKFSRTHRGLEPGAGSGPELS